MFLLAMQGTLKKNKCKLDEVYYSIPKSCIKEFLRLCPYCVPSRTKKEQQKVPLKMILTPRIGHRAQIDLIDMGALAIDGVRYVLRYVDHLSGFSYVDTLKTKSAEEVKCSQRLLSFSSVKDNITPICW
jgi:hypothetical protein